MPPKIIYGYTPQQVREKHDEIVEAGYVEATLKDGTVARRGIRKDRHTLLTAVASYPLLTAQVADDAAAREDYERWVELNVRWLKDTFGDQLVSVIEHVDEEHPHIHAFILPLGDASCSALLHKLGSEAHFPFPRTDLSYGLCDRYAKSGVAVEHRNPDLELSNLPSKSRAMRPWPRSLTQFILVSARLRR